MVEPRTEDRRYALLLIVMVLVGCSDQKIRCSLWSKHRVEAIRECTHTPGCKFTPGDLYSLNEYDRDMERCLRE